MKKMLSIDKRGKEAVVLFALEVAGWLVPGRSAEFTTPTTIKALGRKHRGALIRLAAQRE